MHWNSFLANGIFVLQVLLYFLMKNFHFSCLRNHENLNISSSCFSIESVEGPSPIHKCLQFRKTFWLEHWSWSPFQFQTQLWRDLGLNTGECSLKLAPRRHFSVCLVTGCMSSMVPIFFFPQVNKYLYTQPKSLQSRLQSRLQPWINFDLVLLCGRKVAHTTCWTWSYPVTYS